MDTMWRAIEEARLTACFITSEVIVYRWNQVSSDGIMSIGLGLRLRVGLLTSSCSSSSQSLGVQHAGSRINSNV